MSAHPKKSMSHFDVTSSPVFLNFIVLSCVYQDNYERLAVKIRV